MNEIYLYTTSEKTAILENDGWEMIEGYDVGIYAPEGAENIIIPYEELHKALREGSKKYFWKEGCGNSYELDEAWELLIDEVYDDIKTDNDEDVVAYLDLKLELINKNEVCE